MTIKLQAFKGIKDVCDAKETQPPYLREASNVDIDDEGKKVSRRPGFGAAFVAGNYHSLWPQRPTPSGLMLGVTGTTLRIINPGGSTTIIRSDLAPNLTMDYVEVNGQVYYSNGQVLGFVENQADGIFPTISKLGGSRMPAGQIIEFYEERLYTIQGGRATYSEPWDFGRTALRKNILQFPGQITMWKAVKDGIYCSFGTQTVFLQGAQPSQFIIIPVSDYAAVRGTVVKFDASLVSSNTPLQGDAVMWYSDKGPCVGLQGGLMINHGMTKYNSPANLVSGAGIVRKTTKGFYQSLTILQN